MQKTEFSWRRLPAFDENTQTLFENTPGEGTPACSQP